MQYYAINTSDSLYHSGIKGMKWGRRRYQNEDGSLTQAGRERYGHLSSRMSEYESRSNEAHRTLDRAKADPRYRQIQAKYQTKADKYKVKSARLQPKNQRIRDEKIMYGKDPGFFKKRSLKKQYKYDKKVYKYTKKVNKATSKVAMLELKAAKADKRYNHAKEVFEHYKNKYVG